MEELTGEDKQLDRVLKYKPKGLTFDTFRADLTTLFIISDWWNDDEMNNIYIEYIESQKALSDKSLKKSGWLTIKEWATENYQEMDIDIHENMLISKFGEKYRNKWADVERGPYKGFQGEIVSFDFTKDLPVILQDGEYNCRAVRLDEIVIWQ